MNAVRSGDDALWGVIRPPLNPTVEPEFDALLGAANTLTDSFDPFPELDLAERLAAYRSTCLPSLARVAAQGAAAIGMACTGFSYDLGIAADVAECAEFERVVGVPVDTAATAVNDLLTELGVTAIALVSPYPDWLTEACARFWTDAGFDVVATETIDNDDVIYETSSDLVERAIDAAHERAAAVDDRAGAVVVAGTGASTLPAIEAFTSATVPIVSSNIALAWKLHRRAPLREVPRLEQLIDRWTTAETSMPQPSTPEHASPSHTSSRMSPPETSTPETNEGVSR